MFHFARTFTLNWLLLNNYCNTWTGVCFSPNDVWSSKVAGLWCIHYMVAIIFFQHCDNPIILYISYECINNLWVAHICCTSFLCTGCFFRLVMESNDFVLIVALCWYHVTPTVVQLKIMWWSDLLDKYWRLLKEAASLILSKGTRTLEFLDEWYDCIIISFYLMYL